MQIYIVGPTEEATKITLAMWFIGGGYPETGGYETTAALLSFVLGWDDSMSWMHEVFPKVLKGATIGKPVGNFVVQARAEHTQIGAGVVILTITATK